ncbi:hypothetical protein ON010_g15482 [Phytophthora cinnamomi]|nr:hypothetical protein ON010_g15482 [Phytophthora cinnamomi]
MLEAGAKRSKIYDYLLEHNENVIQSDVDNLVRIHSSAVSSANDDDATAAEVARFMAEDPRNMATVAATSTGESGVISLASVHMRELYERFPEMLLVDSSHKTTTRRLSTVLRYTTHYVAKALEPQYAIGLFKANSYTFEVDQEDANFVHVQWDCATYKLSVVDWRCDCDFASSVLLPCRHDIAYRKHAAVPGAIIPLTRMDLRWTVPAVDLTEVNQFEYTDFESAARQRARQRTPQKRYREAVRATASFQANSQTFRTTMSSTAWWTMC